MAYLDLAEDCPRAALALATRAPATPPPAPPAKPRDWSLLGNAAMAALLLTIVGGLFGLMVRAFESVSIALLVTTLLLLPMTPFVTPRYEAHR